MLKKYLFLDSFHWINYRVHANICLIVRLLYFNDDIGSASFSAQTYRHRKNEGGFMMLLEVFTPI
jgi:hypothetical protein